MDAEGMRREAAARVAAMGLLIEQAGTERDVVAALADLVESAARWCALTGLREMGVPAKGMTHNVERRSLACARTKLDECAMWLHRARAEG